MNKNKRVSFPLLILQCPKNLLSMPNDNNFIVENEVDEKNPNYKL